MPSKCIHQTHHVGTVTNVASVSEEIEGARTVLNRNVRSVYASPTATLLLLTVTTRSNAAAVALLPAVMSTSVPPLNRSNVIDGPVDVPSVKLMSVFVVERVTEAVSPPPRVMPLGKATDAVVVAPIGRDNVDSLYKPWLYMVTFKTKHSI